MDLPALGLGCPERNEPRDSLRQGVVKPGVHHQRPGGTPARRPAVDIAGIRGMLLLSPAPEGPRGPAALIRLDRGLGVERARAPSRQRRPNPLPAGRTPVRRRRPGPFPFPEAAGRSRLPVPEAAGRSRLPVPEVAGRSRLPVPGAAGRSRRVQPGGTIRRTGSLATGGQVRRQTGMVAVCPGECRYGVIMACTATPPVNQRRDRQR